MTHTLLFDQRILNLELNDSKDEASINCINPLFLFGKCAKWGDSPAALSDMLSIITEVEKFVSTVNPLDYVQYLPTKKNGKAKKNSFIVLARIGFSVPFYSNFGTEYNHKRFVLRALSEDTFEAKFEGCIVKLKKGQTLDIIPTYGK